jgi:hypothetical protein
MIKKPLGRFSPWVWSIEFVRGCNLSCWHCTARIFPEDGIPKFMPVETWEALCKVMARVTPRGRLELAQGGEPTLHPHLLECISIAKRLSPTTQIQVTTNGLNLLNGKFTFNQLFRAGANSVYVDMYAPFEKYEALVKASGVEWYKYDRSGSTGTPGHRMANTYYGDPSMRLIILQDHPEERLRWRKVGRLSTFLNHIDWKVAIPYGLVPVRETYRRKCTMPMRYVSTSYEGDYLFCCIDFWCETAKLMGSVLDGPDGFTKFWFGRLMQQIRRHLLTGDRASVPYCSRCNCAFSKCDWVKMWPESIYSKYFDGAWKAMPPIEEDGEVFAPGWQRAKELVFPTKEEEETCLAASSKRIIKSTAAFDKCKCSA